MSIESDVQAALGTVCPRVVQTVALTPPARPYLVWQFLGGRTLRYLDATAADKRNVLVQVAAWADKSADAIVLVRQAEEVLCAALVCEPQGEALSTYEEDTKLFGAIQRFSITAPRA